MASIRFYLDHPKDKKGKLKHTPVAVYLFLTMPAQRYQINTGLRVIPKLWDSVRSRLKPQAAGSMKVNDKLAEMEQDAFSCYLKYRHLGSIELRNKLKKIGDVPVSESSVLKILDTYIQNRKVSPNTIKKYKSLKIHLKAFYKKSGQPSAFITWGCSSLINS